MRTMNETKRGILANHEEGDTSQDADSFKRT